MADTKTVSFDVAESLEHGIYHAVFLEELRRWLSHNKRNKQSIRDGHVWSYNTYEDMIDSWPFFKNITRLKRIVDDLREKKVILTAQYGTPVRGKFGRDLWITINEPTWIMHSTKMTPCTSYQNDTMIHSTKMTPCNKEAVKSTTEKKTAVKSSAAFSPPAQDQDPDQDPDQNPAFSSPTQDQKTQDKDKDLPDHTNPAYAIHQRIAEDAITQNGQTHNIQHIRQLIKVIDDCTEEWTIEQQENLLPQFITMMHDKGEAIKSLPGILQFNSRPDRDYSSHPYGQMMSNQRPDPTDDNVQMADEMSQVIQQEISEPILKPMEPLQSMVGKNNRDIRRNRLKHLQEIEPTETDFEKADRQKLLIREQLQQMEIMNEMEAINETAD